MQSDACRDALKQALLPARTLELPAAGDFWVTGPLDEPGSHTGFAAPRVLRFLQQVLQGWPSKAARAVGAACDNKSERHREEEHAYRQQGQDVEADKLRGNDPGDNPGTLPPPPPPERVPNHQSRSQWRSRHQQGTPSVHSNQGC